MPKPFSYVLNSLGLLLVNLVLLGAFYFQFTLHELPCPLCLLQRVAIASVAVLLVANLIRGEHPAHYGLMLLASTSGIMVSVRQILLHIAPGNPGYGAPVFGYHFYTWATLVFFLMIIGVGIMLLVDEKLRSLVSDDRFSPSLGWVEYAGVGLTLILLLGNALSVFLACGLHACPDNPIAYLLLNH